MDILRSILIIDDTEGDILLLKHKFRQSTEKFIIFDANNEQDAKKQFSRQSPDIVLVDYHLGHTNGVELVKYLREQNYDGFIVLLTGVGSEKVIIEAFKAGADEYYNKDDLSLDSIERLTRAATIKYENKRKVSLLEQQVLNAQKLESLGLLASGIAHDFNNLLTAISGNIQVALLKEDDKVAQRQFLQNVLSVTQNASELTQQMLDYTGKGVYETKIENLSKLIKDMSRFLGVTISKKSYLKYEIESDIYSKVDKSQIQQIVQNLVKNASDAIGDKPGCITLTTSTKYIKEEELENILINDQLNQGEYSVIEVSDNGNGINKRALNKLFDPFFTTKSAGKGLGLASVLGIVRAHKGGISVESIEDVGTTFKVYLPLTKHYKKSKVTVEEKKQKIGMENATILVVDDEPHIRTTLECGLEYANYNVITANNGEEMIELFNLNDIDLILVDKTMPIKDGIEAIREIRNLDVRIPIILMSGYSSESIEPLIDELNISSFIKKPFDIQQVTNTVTKLVPLNRSN